MNKFTLKSFDLKNGEGNSAIFFSSTVSNYDKPSLIINVGYYAEDGDRWELSYGQLIDLKDMIDDVLKVGSGLLSGSYKNDFVSHRDYKEEEFLEIPENTL